MEDHGMQAIEVDPTLYIMCRLCVEEIGRYQILPSIQENIKYCFNINIDHFDGLPQLLCHNCNQLLNEYTANKKKFIEKQEILKNKLKSNRVINVQPQSKSIVINTTIEKDNAKELEVKETNKLSLKTDKRKRVRLISNSSDENEVVTQIKKKPRSQSKKEWKKKYITYFVCNLCSNRYKKRKQLLLHVHNDHSAIKIKYDFILNKLWKVKLNNVDRNLNKTGSTDKVVFNDDKIIQCSKNAFYHILHVSRNKIHRSITPDKTTREGSMNNIYTDYSDNDFYISKKKSRKFRPISRSSNETVLIEGNNNKNVDGENYDSDKGVLKLSESTNEKTNIIKTESECINIDDSTDSDMDISTSKSSKSTVSAKVEYKTISNIISVCKTKYLRKIESNKSTIQSESFLKHKVLSIGRKIIKKEGQFNCNGLLRYMEHKDLDILWLPKRNVKSYGENLVRIMTKLKPNDTNENSNDNVGWVDLEDRTCDENSELIDSYTEITDEPVCDAVTTSISSNTSPMPHIIISGETNLFQNSFLTVQGITNTVIHNDDHSELSSQAGDSDIHSKKLLNKTPVANPKHFPKKICVLEAKLNTVDSKTGADIFKSPLFGQIVEEQKENPNLFSMPVITSTTSLADLTEPKNQCSGENISKVESADVVRDTERNVPRIKVKPVSELMKPENILNTNDSHNILSKSSDVNLPSSNGSIGNYIVPGMILPQIQSVQSMQYSQHTTIMDVDKKPPESVNNNCTDPITLDTVEFPNTTTYSPFKYFKMLLSLHNITLLEPNAPFVRDYFCLLKIKVHFKQENKAKVVVLCLSIFYLRDQFCICIKDTNQIGIQMSKISANWQWEILKIFQGDVSNKILHNAQKAGQDIYAKTKTFICVLKSINCK